VNTDETGIHNEVSGTVLGNVVQAGHIDQVTVAVAPRPIMSGLPAEPAHFVGRDRVLAEVAALLEASGSIVMSGPPGVGKTALALRAAHAAMRAGRFPGGVLFADLHGYDPAPAQPAETLARFVRALGLPDEQVPVGPDELETTYRSLLAQRAVDAGNVLVLLDNASSSAQIRPLLPGAGGHQVLMTSRHRLSDLDGVHRLGLDVLDPAESLSLLAASDLVGDRLRREPDAAREVAALCGHLPLALRIAAVLLVDDPTQPVSELAHALRDERHRLAELRYGDDLDVRAAFDLSYGRLSAAERRMFRLLSLAPGHHISEKTATVLAGLEPREASRILTALCRAHMLQPSEHRGWYRFHDLIGLYALQMVEQEDSPEEKNDAVDRMLVELYDFIDEGLDKLRKGDGELTEAATTLAVLREERSTLIGAVELAHRSGRHDLTVLLAERAGNYLQEVRQWADAARMFELAVASALIGEHTEHEATLRVDLASTLVFLRSHQECVEHLSRALEIGRDIGHRGFLGVVLRELGAAYHRLEETAKSIEYFRLALEIATETENVQEQGTIFINIGSTLQDAGDVAGAVEHYNRALSIFRRAGSRGSVAATQRLLAGVYLESLGEYDVAFDLYWEAMKTYEDLGDLHSAADIWYQLGHVCLRGGRPETAGKAWRTAALIAKRIDYADMVKDAELMLTTHDLTEDGPDN
jgi:tetratricopeptide (TPR) repeat protein